MGTFGQYNMTHQIYTYQGDTARIWKAPDILAAVEYHIIFSKSFLHI
jgi:protein associated with RNAse G/E